jgi:hypothetical protein
MLFASDVPDPTISMLWFFIITSIYFFLRFNTQSKLERRIYTGVYILLLIVGMYFINLSLTTAMCGTRQWQTAMNVTAIPWLMIFGVLNLFLQLFPDWLNPFANTFGYALAKLLGASELFKSLFKDPNELTGTNAADVQVMRDALDKIYFDDSLLLNELSVDTLPTFFTRMNPILKPMSADDKTKVEQQLTYFLNIKEDVALYVWYMLTGAFVTAVSYNYIVGMKCNNSLKDMQKLEKQLTEAQAAQTQKADASKQQEQSTLPDGRIITQERIYKDAE